MVQEHTGLFIVHIRIWPSLASASFSQEAVSPPWLRNDIIFSLEVKYLDFFWSNMTFSDDYGPFMSLKYEHRCSSRLFSGTDM